jgi:hypothetical protein
MKKLVSRIYAFFALPACFAAGAISMAQTSAPVTVQLSPGSNVQAAVSAAPPGSTFKFAAGVYRMQSVVPLAGDIFKGKLGVIFNGSQVLTFQLDPAGSGYWVASATASTAQSGTCTTGFPLCGYTQDLFINSKLQTPASTNTGLQPGSWYFDRANNLVYLPTNPAGQTVELGMSQYAFYGSAPNVQIQNIVVEKYANLAQTGAVGGDTWTDGLGSGWIVTGVEARWNHGGGIVLGTNSQIMTSFIHHNGQIGIKLFGTSSVAASNEISWNNYANYAPSWEAGGSKFSTTTNLTVQFNYVHDNNGNGLWTDINNVGTLYQNNTVLHNLGSGIVHEISYTATIKNNVVKGNGYGPTVWLWNAQIAILNSPNVNVFDNTIEVPNGAGNGIAVINQNRGTGTLGPWVATNDSVHNNVITYLGTGGVSGLGDDTGGTSAVGNQFDSDQYILANGGGLHWYWLTTSMNWSTLQAAGHEVHGTCCQ